ncbi:carboxyl-terminal processing protease [Paenibacillus phyllosphaerae]|uniref:Carboxyl-terminal processing protease n=1 Tax=Paenibacillus phyllosphaerae TaxID=274593 RepID=A0A7W5B4E9_9BACL|nr:S41 family peptidase [Paenibacillus phyllosphaerae]MBB3114225.1 carboxyl-terminal processing protease [Paenibacillus phyllosphaerae]
MQFKGRTVAAFVLLTMAVSVMLTLVVSDRQVAMESGKTAGAASSESTGQDGLTTKEEDKLDAVMELIEQKYYKEVDRSKVVDGAITGMMEALDDPYSVYMEKETAQHFSESIEGSFSGIGAEVALQDGKVTVVSPIKDSPADKAGVLAKDVLLSVNGDSLEGLALNDAVAKIRGPKGTKVKLIIARAGVTEPIHLVLVRDDIDYETVYSNLRSDGVGVIEIRQFSLNTGERFLEELDRLEKQGMKGLVIDVRNNPGGVLPVVVSVAQPFVPQGKPIVLIEDRTGEKEQTLSKGTGKKYPVAVLMNKGSASASEVLAGALKEAGGAVLVGENSFGKGTVQVSYDKATGDGSLVKMTIAKWLTPLGNWVHEKGLAPDVEVLPPDYYTVARLSKSKTLEPDTLGEDVRSLQIMLDGLGYKVDRKDGYFSAVTAESVKQFQKKASLTVTGKVDVQTAEKIEEALVAQIRDEKNDAQLNKAVEVVKEKTK